MQRSVRMLTDHSPVLLKGNPQGALLARTPPTIDFGIVGIDPHTYGTEYGAWGNVVGGPDSKYYFGFGNHSTAQQGQDGALLASYDPTTQKQDILVFSKQLLASSGGEGKWEGRPDINPSTGDMYLIGFYNGHVIHYNIYTKQAEDLGTPVPGSGWQEHTWDWQRERLYGVGDDKGSILVYDTKHHTVIHQGQPVDSRTGKPFSWEKRGRLLDRETGNVYGTDATHHVTKYDATTNTFTLLRSTLPSRARAWANQKEADGSFWIFDDQGDIYKFYPDQDRLVSKGKNWGGNGWYVTFLERRADGHYLYYSLAQADASPGPPTTQGQPVLQYNTQTHTIKVLAFLSPYYAATHQYQTTKIYGGALSADGSSLFVISNGNTLVTRAGDIVKGSRIPALFDIHIPASER